MTKSNWLGQYFAFSLAVLTSCGGAQHRGLAPRSSDPVAERARNMAVALNVTCVTTDGTYQVGGSGVPVSPRHMLTARHVVGCEGGTAWKVIGTDVRGRKFELTVDKMDPESKDEGGPDVARLVAVGTAEPFGDWADLGNRPRLEDKLCAATAVPSRYWLCGAVTETGNIVTGTCDVDFGMFSLPVPCPVWKEDPHGELFNAWGAADFGNSGSGVFDAHGRLVGLLVRLSADSAGGHVRWIVDGRVKKYMRGLQSMGWFLP